MLDRDVPAAPNAIERRFRGPGRPSLRARYAAAARSAAARTANAARTQIRSVIAGLPEAILLTDEQDRVQLTNPAADALFADRPVRDREDLCSRFEPGDGVTDEASVVVRLRHRPDRSFAIETYPLDRVAVVGRGQGSAFVLRDVSDSHAARQEGEAFLSIMSHELRTPITTIYAGSSVLAGSAALTPPASKTLARDISAEAARLYDLVEDLIVVARLERRVLEPIDEPVLLQRVADATARVVAGRATGVEFVRDGDREPPPVLGDATYIEQAARDLAVAAARFGGTERPVTIRLEHEPGSREVAFRVLDRGPQLTAEEERRAFDLPDDSAFGRRAGVGVGPFVARRLIEAMAGRVWAANRPDGGVEMGFALPVATD